MKATKSVMISSNCVGDYFYTPTKDYYYNLHKELAFRYPNDPWNSYSSCVYTSTFVNFHAGTNYCCGWPCTTWYSVKQK